MSKPFWNSNSLKEGDIDNIIVLKCKWWTALEYWTQFSTLVYYTVDGGPFVGDGKHSTRRKPSTKANLLYVCVQYISLWTQTILPNIRTAMSANRTVIYVGPTTIHSGLRRPLYNITAIIKANHCPVWIVNTNVPLCCMVWTKRDCVNVQICSWLILKNLICINESYLHKYACALANYPPLQRATNPHIFFFHSNKFKTVLKTNFYVLFILIDIALMCVFLLHSNINNNTCSNNYRNYRLFLFIHN